MPTVPALARTNCTILPCHIYTTELNDRSKSPPFDWTGAGCTPLNPLWREQTNGPERRLGRAPLGRGCRWPRGKEEGAPCSRRRPGQKGPRPAQPAPRARRRRARRASRARESREQRGASGRAPPSDRLDHLHCGSPSDRLAAHRATVAFHLALQRPVDDSKRKLWAVRGFHSSAPTISQSRVQPSLRSPFRAPNLCSLLAARPPRPSRRQARPAISRLSAAATKRVVPGLPSPSERIDVDVCASAPRSGASRSP